MDTSEEMRSSTAGDQYREYANLPKLLNRFSFREKMAIATLHSSAAILFGQKMRSNAQYKGVLPWCIETFVMLSMEAKEYSNNDFRGKNEKKFLKMCDAIWDATSVLLEMPCGRFDFIDTFMAVTGLTQFHTQEFSWIRRYRYWRVFCDNSEPVCMEDVFTSKMGTKYEDYLLLGHMLQILFVAQGDLNAGAIPQGVLYYLLYKRFPEAASRLKITRTAYVELQKRFAANSDDPRKYVYSLRPSYQYAFVEDGDSIYFPLPHLLNENVTSALFYRLTDGDDTLRGIIGKNIWEKYLLRLIENTGIYQEVYPEQIYRHNGSNSQSPDVLARQGQDVLFIDSKSTVPNIGIRLLDAESYEKNIGIVADNVVKLYKQIKRFKKYNPFKGDVSDTVDNYWGIVVVLEDSYIRRVRYFEKARSALKIEENTAEWNWLITHIKVVSLYEIERISLWGYSVIDACKESLGNDPFNYIFMGFPTQGGGVINPEFLDFRETIEEKTLQLVSEMEEAGIIC